MRRRRIGTWLLAAGLPIATLTATPVTATATTTHTLPARPDARDVSWVSATHGWLVAGVPCGSHRCTQLYRTVDGGRNWRQRHTPRDVINAGHDATIDFTSGGVGYLEAKQLFATRDGGSHWRRAPGRFTAALAIAGSRTYRIAYRHSGCPGPCSPRIQAARTGSISFHTVKPVRRATPSTVTIAASGDVVIAAFEGNPEGGAASAHSTLVESRDAGRHWMSAPDPCGGSRAHEADAVDVAVAPHATVAVLCVRRHSGRSFTEISDTGGQGFVRRAVTPVHNAGEIALLRRGVLAVATVGTVGSGRFTYQVAVSSTGGSTWREVVHDRSAVYSNQSSTASLSAAGKGAAYVGSPRDLWVTTHDGAHWKRRSVPA